MSTGQLLFYSGIGLLILTIILACIFWVKKPQYIPGNAAYDGMGNPKTRKLRSGYPTDRLTVRREETQAVTPVTAVIQEEIERLNDDQPKLTCDTEVLSEAGKKKSRETERLLRSTSLLAAGTEPLDARTTPLSETTEPLDDQNPSR